MRFKNVEVADFRNIQSARLDLDHDVVALIGQNGQGKTNSLEALYMLAALRPLRSVKRQALMRSGTERARVAAQVFNKTPGLTHELELQLGSRQRKLIKDTKSTIARNFIGTLVAVAFTPDDLDFAKGGPDRRRKFVDRAVLNGRPAYLQQALRYTKAVRDRNRVLADEGSNTQLEAFDELVALEGAKVTMARSEYIRALDTRCLQLFEQICQPAPELELSYATRLQDVALGSEDVVAQALLDKLRRRHPVARARRTTSVGPHLDDIELRFDGAPVKDRASQGQHRALVRALKLAEIELATERLGEPPVLLLDDMSSELDDARTRQLFETVRAMKAQVILSSTRPVSEVAELIARPVFGYSVAQGTIASPGMSGG